MKEYKVYEVEDKATPNGKTLKKLVLQGEGDQYPMKNVTMWSNHSLFETIKVGDKHTLNIEVKDSTTPNPHGGFYKNRTVLENMNPNGTIAPLPADLTELKRRVDILWGERGVEETVTPAVEYPEEDIKPEDIPF